MFLPGKSASVGALRCKPYSARVSCNLIPTPNCAGKYTPGGTKAAGPRSAMFSEERLAQVAPLLGLMRDVGSAHGSKTCAQVAINWTICKGALPIPGLPLLVPCCTARLWRMLRQARGEVICGRMLKGLHGH